MVHMTESEDYSSQVPSGYVTIQLSDSESGTTTVPCGEESSSSSDILTPKRCRLDRSASRRLSPSTNHLSSLCDGQEKTLVGEYHIRNGSQDAINIFVWSEVVQNNHQCTPDPPDHQEESSLPRALSNLEVHYDQPRLCFDANRIVGLPPLDTLSVPGDIRGKNQKRSILKKSSSFAQPRVETVNDPANEYELPEDPLPRSVSALSRLSTFSHRVFCRWNSRRFQRTMRIPRRGRRGDLVTSYSMAEDFCSLSIILFILCIVLDPPFIVLVIPSIILSTLARRDERKGKKEETMKKLSIVALLHCITFIGGLIGTLIIVVVTLVFCVKN